VYVVGPDQLADVRKITVMRTDGERTIVTHRPAEGRAGRDPRQLRLGPKTRVQIGKPAAEPS